MTTLREVLDRADPNVHPDAEREARPTRMARVRSVRGNTADGTLASDTIALAEADRALFASSAYVAAGASTGVFAPSAVGVAPAAGQVGVSPTGELVFNAADAVTDAEVTYTTIDADDPVDLQNLPVVAGVLTLPSSLRAALILSAQDVTIPDTPVTLTPLFRGATPAGATEVAVGDDPNTLVFDPAVTAATVRILPQSARTLNDRLNAQFG